MSDPQGIGSAARAAILWGGGVTLLRDVIQFLSMLVLVRLLSPEDYGSAALAQSIIGLISVVSFGTFSLHTLQLRDPNDVDWHLHFTAAVVINVTLFLVALLIAWSLFFTDRYSKAALPLAGLATVLLVEIAGTLRHRMLETQHNWMRFRILVIIGVVLGTSAGLTLAALGGGVWALVVQVPLFGLPAAVDLLWLEKWRPRFSWTWLRYREVASFGFNRIAASAALRGRQTFEQTVLVGAHDFAVLGIFSRSLGLATLIAGRIGSLTMLTLYPVITRVEQRSSQFRAISGLVLQGVLWTTVPAAVVLALCANEVVALIYGAKWEAVSSLMPLAVAGVACSGISSSAASLLLANREAAWALKIDITSACLAAGLAIWLIPQGIDVYLAGLIGHGLIILLITLVALVTSKGIARAAILPCFAPAALSSLSGAGGVIAIRLLCPHADHPVLQLFLESAAFFAFYLMTLRVAFSVELKALLVVVPGGIRVMKLIFGSHDEKEARG